MQNKLKLKFSAVHLRKLLESHGVMRKATKFLITKESYKITQQC